MGLSVPEADGLVGGARGQQFAVGAEDHSPDVVGVPAQDGDRGVCGDVPETDGPVYSGGGEQVAVGMKSHVSGALVVSLESGDLPPRGHVPESHRPLEGPRRQQRARRVQ